MRKSRERRDFPFLCRKRHEGGEEVVGVHVEVANVLQLMLDEEG
jgi:hypothetical protein